MMWGKMMDVASEFKFLSSNPHLIRWGKMGANGGFVIECHPQGWGDDSDKSSPCLPYGHNIDRCIISSICRHLSTMHSAAKKDGPFHDSI